MNKSNHLIAASRVAVAVAAVCASLSAPAFAADNKALLDLMLKKGVITQKDYDEFVDATRDADENKAFKEKRVDQDLAKANAYMQKNADAGQVMKSGLGIQSADGESSIQLTGRIHMDYRNYGRTAASGSTVDPLQDAFEVRRARLGVKGQFMKDWKYELVGNYGMSGNGMSSGSTEIDVAYEWEQQRPGGPRPILGVTGTDGKTTTTMVAAHLLRSTGRDVAEVGNTDLPFMAALEGAHDAFVVECSSFRLQYTDVFRCDASVWLNLAPDHLDWHGDLGSYVAAKSRLWAHVRGNDVVVAPEGNDIVLGAARSSGGRVVTFGLDRGDYRVESGALVGPHGPLVAIGALWRSMPHDITNSLAAAAIVVESGLAAGGSLAAALGDFAPAHHRIEFVATHGGSDWYDDSKATSPHAALTAIRAFDRLVLIAGGRNKDLDLSQMAGEPARMQGVVAIGDDAPAIESAFAGICPVVRAGSMQQAVAAAAAMATPGVAVVLSPGCTSYDWYRNYNERGEDFVRCVSEHFGGNP